MYESFWNLQGKPFLNTPNPRFVFYSDSHEEALVRMLYSVTESKGLMLLLGEEGIGKTYIANIFANEIRGKGYPVGLLKSPGRTPDDLMVQILYEFGIPHRNVSRVEKMHLLNEAAVSLGRIGRLLVLLIDDAQRIQDPETFEEIRSLLNISGEEHFLVNIILCGSPELWGHLVKIPGMRSRVGVSYRILPLPLEETAEYIRHRLACVGREKPIFTDEAVEVVHSTTRGVPRQINNLCDLCLLIGSGEDVDIIKPALVEKALEETAGLKTMGEGER